VVRLLHRYGHGVVCNSYDFKSKGLWWYCVVSKGDTAVGSKSLPSAPVFLSGPAHFALFWTKNSRVREGGETKRENTEHMRVVIVRSIEVGAGGEGRRGGTGGGREGAVRKKKQAESRYAESTEVKQRKEIASM
jgi:hypothetical protein